jgi:hypothetical protein
MWVPGNAVKNAPMITTNVMHYIPQANALPDTTESGSCFTTSIAAPYRADAWRCTVGNEISDPCFQISGSKDLLCEPDPADTSTPSGFVLKLTGPLPKPEVSTSTSNQGWMVELSDETICTPFTGTLPFSVEGDVANYSCNSKLPVEGLLFNGLDSSTTPWTAEAGMLSTSTISYPPRLISSTTVQIKNVWQ